MNIKNLAQFILTVLLLSSCFKNNCDLRMQGDGTEEKKDDGVDLYAASIYEKFTSLVDNPDVYIEEVMEFLSVNKKYLDGSNGERYPFIHYVVECGESALVEEMVKAYPDLLSYKAGEWSREPLHVAARKGYIDIVKVFVNNGADLNAIDDKGNSVLHYACSTTQYNKELVEFLISKGADPYSVNEVKCTVLYMATKFNNIELVEYLVSVYPAMVNLKAEKGVTPLYLAVDSNYTPIFKLFIESKAFESDAIIEHIDNLIVKAKKRGNQYMIKELESIKNGQK
jgi:hypothetical protein